MTTKTIYAASLLVTVASLSAKTTYANDFLADGKNQANGVHGFVGFGLGAVNEYEGADSYQVIPFIAGRVQKEHRYAELMGIGARANVLNHEHIQFGPALRFRFGRDNDVDNITIARLADVDDAFEAGMFIRYDQTIRFMPGDSAGLEARFLHDVSGAHDGYEISLGTNYNAPVSRKLRLGFDIGTSYASENYMQTYYSITPQNIGTSGLPLFNAQSGFKDVSLGFNAQYALNTRWGVFSRAQYTRLVGDASDSPIINGLGSNNQFLFGAGLSYRF